MAQITIKPILSLCIPIYNRRFFLERQLNRLMEDKDLFVDKIQLIISDNCSSDNLQECVEEYKKQGLNLFFHRNETNIGPDGNFCWCFHHAKGRYVWLLGSDDILVTDVLKKLINILDKSDFGLIHLSTIPQKKQYRIYNNDEKVISDIGVRMTFISSNIICSSSLKSIDLVPYMNSNMIQVPAYLNACLRAEKNIIVYLGKPFEDNSDMANNGGYNIFEVFVDTFWGMYQHFVKKGLLSQVTYEQAKRSVYKNWLVRYVVILLLLRKPIRKKFDLSNSWSILFKHYGKYPYFYYYTLMILCKEFLKNVIYRFIRTDN